MADAPAKKRGPVAAILIVVVVGGCCVSSGAFVAIGWDAFQGYIARSKTSEATSNLSNLYQLSASYYAGERFGAGLGSGAPPTSCTVGPAVSSNTPGENKTVLDWTNESASFRDLGFAVADPMYYQYEIAGGPGRCAHPPSAPVYSLRAHGDLDGDGERSLFELAVGSTADGSLERAAGIYTERDVE